MSANQPSTFYNDIKFMPFLKLIVYGWLTYNAGAFLVEELAAVQATHSGRLTTSEFLGAFSATIDTIGWVVLLYIMELETNLIPDHKWSNVVERTLQSLRAMCYVAIVFAWYGYIGTWLDWTAAEVIAIQDLCALVETGLNNQPLSLINDFDDYAALTAANCTDFSGVNFQYIQKLSLIGESDIVDTGTALALTDVINSSVWLMIVGILEIELRLQNNNNIEWSKSKVLIAAKAVLYAILFGCLIFWVMYGGFIDTADAFLWLFAFFFIELNILDWATEIEQDSSDEAPAS